MKVLVACEFSGVVRDAFIASGHDAMSCDLEPGLGDGPHHHGNVFEILYKGWDLMIAHPPCTFLCNSGVKHLYIDGKKENGVNLPRWRDMAAGAEFFLDLLNAPIPRIAIENPIMHRYAKEIIGKQQDQVVQPWHFGHEQMKATCLWLKGLPKLQHTNIVGPPPKNKEERKKWADCHRASPGPDRWKHAQSHLKALQRPWLPNGAVRLCRAWRKVHEMHNIFWEAPMGCLEPSPWGL